MKAYEIFDLAMCCATGVCGPAVDPELARFAGELAAIVPPEKERCATPAPTEVC